MAPLCFKASFVPFVELCYNENMKILYVCTSTEVGGAEKAFFTLVQAALHAGHEVKVLSLRPLGPLGRQLQEAGLSVESLDMRGKCRPLETAGALARLIAQIQAFAPDIVHAGLYRAIQFCRLAKRRIPFILVTTPHYDLSRKSYFLRLLDRALKDGDDVSCAESQSTADFLLQKQKYAQNKVRLVANGVDLQAFRPDHSLREDTRAELGFAAQEIIFTSVARLSKEKNHALLLQAFQLFYAKHPQSKLLLVGGGPEQENLRRQTQELGLDKAVIFAGEVSNVCKYLCAADVFVLPSCIESLPLALLEAVACGLPAIVSKVGDMPQVVCHGENGFVFNGKDPILLAVLMTELAENTDLRQKMGRAARARVERFYPAPEQIYLKIYTEIK